MKYSEYQIWYHVYNSVATALAKNPSIFEQLDYPEESVIQISDNIASHAVEKFSNIEDVPQTPTQPSVDIQNLINSAISDSLKKKR